MEEKTTSKLVGFPKIVQEPHLLTVSTIKPKFVAQMTEVTSYPDDNSKQKVSVLGRADHFIIVRRWDIMTGVTVYEKLHLNAFKEHLTGNWPELPYNERFLKAEDFVNRKVEQLFVV